MTLEELKGKVVTDPFKKEYTIDSFRKWSNGTIVAYMKDSQYFANIEILRDKETGKFLDEILLTEKIAEDKK